MVLDQTARERLQDVRELEPTSNSELADRWGMESGKDVAAYLDSELSEYTYRDENSRIRSKGEPPDEPDAEERQDGVRDDAEGSDAGDDGNHSGDGGASPVAARRAKDESRTTEGNADDDPPEKVDDGPPEPARDVKGTVPPAEASPPDATGQDDPEVVEEPEPVEGGPEPSPGVKGRVTPEQPEPQAIPDLCPECGSSLLTGETVAADVKAKAEENGEMRSFLEANRDADPDYACKKVRACGYYVEDGESKTFNQPGSGGSGGAFTVLVALVVGGIALLRKIGGKSGGDGDGESIPVAGE